MTVFEVINKAWRDWRALPQKVLPMGSAADIEDDDNGLPSNATRAEWGNVALDAFAGVTRSGTDYINAKGELCEELLSDLVCDAMHHAESVGADALQAVRYGIGAWSAERRATDSNPRDNDKVSVYVAPADKLAGDVNTPPGNPGMHPMLWTYVDGLDASVDGRGWDASHEAAKARIEKALALLDAQDKG